MNFFLATCAALFLLLAAASCAPAGGPDACAGVQGSSQELNHLARTVSEEARNGSKYVSDFSTSLLWMEAKDKCDPGTLRQKSVPCVEKILSVLTGYISAVERVSGFQSCSAFASKVKPVMQKLHKDMSKCVTANGGMDQEEESNISKEETEPILDWQEALLCHYTMDRLFSFSILTARVFAVGDPTHHAEGSAQTCL
ncbi:uncharacterized protein LOC119490069, partial [Lates japonicus]